MDERLQCGLADNEEADGEVWSVCTDYLPWSSCYNGATSFGGHRVTARTSGAAFDVPAMGISFTPLDDGSVTQPTLPSGRQAIGLSEALDLAGRHAGSSVDPRSIPDVVYIARYGSFSDTQVTTAVAPGVAVHPLADRVAWLVQYSGPGVQIPSDGPAGAPVIYSHRVTVAIDAATGEFIEMYVG